MHRGEQETLLNQGSRCRWAAGVLEMTTQRSGLKGQNEHPGEMSSGDKGLEVFRNLKGPVWPGQSEPGREQRWPPLEPAEP